MSRFAEYLVIMVLYAIVTITFMSSLFDRAAWFWFGLASWIFLIATLCYAFGGAR